MIQSCARKFIRVNCDGSLHIITSDDVSLDAQIKNISLGGIEMSCDRAAAVTIMPRGYYFDPEHPTVLSAKVDIADIQNTLEVICYVKNMRRLAENSFAFNLAFFNLKPESQQTLENFVQPKASSHG